MARLAVTKAQVATGVSIAWLVAITVLGCFATYLINKYSLPLSNFFSALTIALPILAAIAFEAFKTVQRRASADNTLAHASSTLQTINAAFLVLETVLITLAASHLGPRNTLWCPLHETWSRLFVAKDATRLARIQDGLNCCGFNSPRDMAFPFPHGSQGADACMVRYDRNTSCVDPWMALERKVAIILLLAPIGIMLWRVAMNRVLRNDSWWLPSAIGLPISADDDGTARNSRNRPAIAYSQVDDESIQEEITRLNNDSSLASHIESGRRGYNAGL